MDTVQAGEMVDCMGDFKRITVTAAEDDEVILAGIGDVETAAAQEASAQTGEAPELSPSAREGEAPELSPSAREGEAPWLSQVDREGAAPEVTPEVTPEPAAEIAGTASNSSPDSTAEIAEIADVADAPSAEQVQVGAAAIASNERAPNENPKRRPRDDGYHETTLEDLESGPMPAAQRITLIVVAVLLVIAIAYYFAFLR